MIGASTVDARHEGSLYLAVPRVTRVFCAGVGLFLLVEDGVIGLIFAGTDFTVSDHLPHRAWNFFFEFNSWHHVLHFATGGLLVVAALKREWAARGAFVFGAIYAVMAPLGFIDGDDVFNVFYSSARENSVHALLAVAGISLGLASSAFGPSERRRRASRRSMAPVSSAR
jgi:Domain of unknown function (DUF4383)